MSNYKSFLDMHGINFDIERNGECVSSKIGLPNHEKSTNRAYIGFMPNTDIQVDDWLINNAGDRFLVVEKQTKYFNGRPDKLCAYTITEAEHQKELKLQNQQTIFNIGDVNNSIVGTQQNATITKGYSIEDLTKLIESHNSDDKELLKEMISTLENVVLNKEPVKKGLLSKFSDVMSRNEWIIAPVMTFLLECFLL